MSRILTWTGLWAILSSLPVTTATAQTKPTIDQFMSPGFPSDLVSAKKADRIAWLADERGRRNVFTAAAPDWKPVRLTKFLGDDGIVLSDLSVSDDGAMVSFVRGSAPNTDGWVANPASDPNGPERAIWAARSNGTGAWRVVEGAAPALSPDGRSIAFARDGQIYVVPSTRTGTTAATDKNLLPTVKEWGRNGDPHWSPDGTKLAYVSTREYHSLIAYYDMRSKKIRYVSPSVDFDASPTWSGDSRQIAFTRRPGTPYGQQRIPGLPGVTGSNPPRPQQGSASRTTGGGPGRLGETADVPADGLYRATLRGGYSLALMVAGIDGDTAREVWHSVPNSKTFQAINRITWAGKSLIFPQEPEEWIRYYAVHAAGDTPTPIELSPGEGALETLDISADGETLVYASNVGDIDRRHLWKVPTSGGAATQITKGTEIEMYPVALASGRQVAALTSSATRPLSVSLIDVSTGAGRVLYPSLGKSFPLAMEAVPEQVILKAADGLEFHNQLFLPKDQKQGEKRPAMIFVHGGPSRQMLLGYHYMDFYHFAYAVNQWLASQGYVVMSVNYRTGIGYGKSFRTAAKSGWLGNAEYQDVVAAGKYLQGRADVDPARVGIWGLSYGGVLTSQALARNSDMFAAGVDMAGVHLWGNTLDTADVTYKSSTIAAIDGWKSPVLIWHGDDDRNVPFAQTIGLVQLLRQKNVPYELIVVPDDTHETLIYDRWMYLFDRMETFLKKNLWDKTSGAVRTGDSRP
ncbi:MAG: prolyl oligopeptidase family serine peptidase [Gemmatimonadota bacterium]